MFLREANPAEWYMTFGSYGGRNQFEKAPRVRDSHTERLHRMPEEKSEGMLDLLILHIRDTSPNSWLYSVMGRLLAGDVPRKKVLSAYMKCQYGNPKRI